MQISQIKNNRGLIVATDIMDSIETVSVAVLVKVGNRNEREIDNGIAHFLEHVFFKGTERRTAFDIASEFDKIGGYLNAYTARERTVYYAKILKDDLPITIDILADIIQNSKFDPYEIEKERSVIIQEIAQTLDSPDEMLFENFQSIAFPNQAFGRSILGSVDNVSSFTQQQIQEYVDNNYYSENIIIGAAGNFKQGAFNALVEEKFTSLKTSGNKYQEDANYVGGDIRINKDLEQVQLVLGFKGVSIYSEEYYVQQLLSIILGGGSSSRLFQEVREKRGLAYYVSSYGYSYSDSGIFGIYGGVSANKANEYLAIIIDEALKLIDTITEDEVNRAKAQLRAGMLMSQESSTSRAEKLVNNIADFGKYITPRKILEEIDKVSIAMLSQFARKIFFQNALPTLASIGKIDKLEGYEKIIEKLKR